MFCIQTQIDGSYRPIDCNSADLLVVTRAELAQMSPFYLDPQSAVEIAGSILMVMSVAFVLRYIRKSLETL
jgi:hypothetical protein